MSQFFSLGAILGVKHQNDFMQTTIAGLDMK